MTGTSDESAEIGRSQDLPNPDWPDDADAAVSLTFDVDAESVLLGQNRENALLLTSMSESRFGITRGLPDILGLLGDLDVEATFYVPGWVAQTYPSEIRRISEEGHEIGHHGYLHLNPAAESASVQEAEVRKGLEALEETCGVRPTGYRAPYWELTPTTLETILRMGLRYDSSCMGDDRPYVEQYGGHEILELPVSWALDDGVYYLFSTQMASHLPPPDTLYRSWLEEFEAALLQRRHMTLTMHPHLTGRGFQLRRLEQLVKDMRDRGRVWFSTHAEVAALYSSTASEAGKSQPQS